MDSERRIIPRINGPFDANWSGASGGHACRLLDVSERGCFVYALATPTAGEIVTVQISAADGRVFSIVGTAAYAEPPMGFAVEFFPLPLEQREKFLAWLRDLPPPAPQ